MEREKKQDVFLHVAYNFFSGFLRDPCERNNLAGALVESSHMYHQPVPRRYVV